jgi:hypothetical protein
MAKPQNSKLKLEDFFDVEPVDFVNTGLPEDLNRRLNKYVIAKAQNAGRVQHGLKTAIMRMALHEWLEKHETDLTL